MGTKKKETAKKVAAKRSVGALENGRCYFVRGVTMYYTGRLVAHDAQTMVLADAAWIADTGRFADALKSGSFAEVEPYPDGVLVRIERSAVLDVSDWAHALPRAQK